jgi:hypothetical protein
MDENLQILLTVLILAIAIVLLLRVIATQDVPQSVKTTTKRTTTATNYRPANNGNFNSENRRRNQIQYSNNDAEVIENYDPTSDPKFAEPRTSLYSHNVAYLPFTSDARDAQLLKINPDKLFDHLADQDLGPYNLNNRQFNTPDAMQGLSEDDLDAIKCMHKQGKKQVRFVDDKVKYDDDYDDNDNNHHHGYGDKKNVDIYCMTTEKINNTSQYDSLIRDALDLDGDDKDLYDMQTHTRGLKPYEQMNEDMAKFDENDEGDVIHVTPDLTPAELSIVIDNYRNKTLSTIYTQTHHGNKVSTKKPLLST